MLQALQPHALSINGCSLASMRRYVRQLGLLIAQCILSTAKAPCFKPKRQEAASEYKSRQYSYCVEANTSNPTDLFLLLLHPPLCPQPYSTQHHRGLSNRMIWSRMRGTFRPRACHIPSPQRSPPIGSRLSGQVFAASSHRPRIQLRSPAQKTAMARRAMLGVTTMSCPLGPLR